ncbi:MAG TPA: hypothetical protein VK557_13565 [Pyrinomonadaceae bacterium]|nr:hypothetical protein [Pyrinomonadaceae bacterium]
MRKKALALVLFVLSSLSLANGQPRQSKSEVLRNVEFNNIDMGSILAALANEYDVAIGLEADPEKPRSQISFHLQNVIFSQILDGIVQAEPRYSWREDDGSIHVFPVNKGFDLLDSRIQSLQLKDVNRALAINRLFGLPEVQALILSKNLKPILPSPLDRARDEKLSFDLRDVTLRQALNQIAHASGSNFWVIRRYPNGTFEIKLQCC